MWRGTPLPSSLAGLGGASATLRGPIGSASVLLCITETLPMRLLPLCVLMSASYQDEVQC